MKKLLRAIVIALFICNVFVSTIYAEPKMKEYYSIDLDSLNINVKQYLTALSIDKDTRAVFMNNVYVGTQTSDPQTFVLSTENYSILANVSVSNLSCTAKVNVATEKHYTAVFDIQIAENTYYVCNFYPDYKSNPSYCVTNKATRNGDIQDFGIFTYTYGNESMSFSVLMTQSDGSVYVNGKNIGSLGKSNIPIVFEYIGSDFPITNIDYQKQLPMFDWPTASSTTKVFYGRNFGDISFKEKYDLSNEYLNLPSVEIAFGSTVKEWHRVSGTSTTGTGEWQPTGREIAVVCEYNENYDISKDCVNAIRNEFPRYWAVWAGNQDFGSSVSKLTKPYKELVDGYVNYYNTGDWTEVDSWPSESLSRLVQKATSTAIWSDWTDWTSEARPNLACSGGNCKAESAKFYRNRTYSWQDTTDWQLTDSCPVSSTQQSIYRTTQNEICGFDYNECQHSDCGINQSTPYIYSNFGGYSTSKYGYQNGCAYRQGQNSECGQTYVRQGCSHNVSYSNNCGKCGSGQNCSTVSEGYTCSKTCYSSGTNASKCGTHQECKTVREGYRCATGTCYRNVNKCSSVANSCTWSYSCTGTCYHDVTRCSNYCKSCTLSEGYDCSYYETNTCTSYTCPNSRTENYAYCRTAACGGAVAKMCTQYKCQSKQYGAWSDYIYKDDCPNDYWAECGDYHVKYRYTDRSWGEWSSWTNATAAVSTSIDLQAKYRYLTPTIKVEKEKATGYEGSSTGWWSGEMESMGLQDVEHEIANVGGRQYWANYSYYTKELVEEFQDKYATSKAGESVYRSLLGNTDKPYVLWDDFEKELSSSNEYKTKLNDIKNQSIYQPYLYFYAWRFITSNMDVPVGNSSKSVIGEQIISYSSNGNLIESSEQVVRDTKVIYFDYKDPLTHYKDELPENWQGYEYLVDEIKNSDLDTSKIKVRLSADDIIAMKEYLENGGYDNVSDCDMIRQFSYIFITTDSELQEWLDSGIGCKIGD